MESGPPDCPPPRSGDMEDQWFRAMDLQVTQILRDINETKEGEDGKQTPIYTLQERSKMFAICQDWITKRRKLKPLEDEDDAPGISMMQKAIERGIEKAIVEKNIVTLPGKRKAGRPRKEDELKRQIQESELARRFKVMEPPPEEEGEAEDAGLQALLKGVGQ